MTRRSAAERGCKVEGCTEPHRAHDYCQLHLRRDQLGIPMDAPMPGSRVCEECGGEHYAKGLCKKHYQARWVRRTPKPTGESKPGTSKTKAGRKRKAAVPAGWDKNAAPAKPTPRAQASEDDSILWDLIPDEDYAPIVALLREKHGRLIDGLGLAEMLGVAA